MTSGAGFGEAQHAPGKLRVSEQAGLSPTSLPARSWFQPWCTFWPGRFCSGLRRPRRASRVIQKLARVAALKANARQYRIAGSVTRAAQREQAIERLYAELPAEAKW
jgi:hypothetical protein